MARRKEVWSWSRLVREHGEEKALALLQYMPGLGEFDAFEGWSEGTGHADPTTTLEHPEVTYPVVGPLDIDLPLLGGYRLWWTYHWSPQGERGRVVGRRDVSSRDLGCPFTGESHLPEAKTRAEFEVHVRRAHESRYGKGLTP